MSEKPVVIRIEQPEVQERAAERLQSPHVIPEQEQEHLVSLISDPNLSFETLTLCTERGRNLTQKQKEKLMAQVESDHDVAFVFYTNLMEAGLAPEDLTEDERWWIERLEKALDESDNPEIIAYLKEHQG